MRRLLLRLAWLAIFICALVPTTALAAEPAEPFTVRAMFEEQLPLAGMRFDVYRVADRSGDGAWSPVPQHSRKQRLSRRPRKHRRREIMAGWRYRRSYCSLQQDGFCGKHEKNQKKLDCKPA